MKFFPINKTIPALIFSILVFGVMPVVFSNRLLDQELALRYICIVLIVISFFIFFLLKSNKLNLPSTNQKITFAVVAYVLINCSSIFISINPYDSLFELIRLFVFMFFYCCVILLLYKNENAVEMLLKGIIVSVFIFSIISLFQFLPLLKNYFEKGIPIEIKLSIASSLGNKNFYSELLLMELPFLIYGQVIFKSLWKKISLVSILLTLFTILILQTLSVWLGLFAGLLFLVWCYRTIFLNLISVKIKYVLFFVCLILFACTIIFSKSLLESTMFSKIKIGWQYINHPDLLDKYTLENNNSTYERIILWRNSLKMIADHPLAGVGLGEWKIYFPSYGMGAAPYMNSGMIRFEKPHNDFILIACESGLPGLIFYMSIFIVAFYTFKQIVKKITNENDKLLIRLMAAALIGFIIISLFGYPNQRPFTMLFLMIVLGVIQTKHLEFFPEMKPKSNSKIYRLIFITGIFISFFALNIGIKRLKAESHLSNALVAQKFKNWGIMIRESQNARYDYFPMDFTSTPIYWYIGFANFYSGNRDEAFVNFANAEKINPNHFNLLNDLGTCYDFEGDHERAKSYYQRANKIALLFPDAIINLSVIYYNEGNIDSAYYFISKNNLNGNPNYLKDLKVILYAKAQKIISQISDPAYKSFLSEKILDEKWLLALHEESVKSHRKLASLLLETK